MMISVILGHPNPGSFNHAIADTVVDSLTTNDHEVRFHDLYAERFDPLLLSPEMSKHARLDPLIQQHCDELARADGIVIIHPNWWGQPPAIMKGWIDRVIRPGVAYEFKEGDKGEGVPAGLLKATSAIIFNTSNTDSKREKGVFSDPLEAIWKNCIFDLCGVKNFYRRTFSVVIISSEEQREDWLKDIKQTTDKYFPKRK